MRADPFVLNLLESIEIICNRRQDCLLPRWEMCSQVRVAKVFELNVARAVSLQPQLKEINLRKLGWAFRRGIETNFPTTRMVRCSVQDNSYLWELQRTRRAINSQCKKALVVLQHVNHVLFEVLHDAVHIEMIEVQFLQRAIGRRHDFEQLG